MMIKAILKKKGDAVITIGVFDLVRDDLLRYVGTQPKTASQAAAAIRAEYAKLAREGLAGTALAEAKQQTQGQLMLSLESPTARMYRLASFPVYGEPYRSLDEVVAAVAGLTEEEIAAVATQFFDPERQTVVWLGKQ